jgi:hypothetical protein
MVKLLFERNNQLQFQAMPFSSRRYETRFGKVKREKTLSAYRLSEKAMP